MKLNPDCCRAVLLAVEEKSLGEIYTLPQLVEKLETYTTDDITYSCLKLSEAGFLDIATATPLLNQYSPTITTIYDITYQGHIFLEKVRNDNIWEETKSKTRKVGAFALDILAQVAGNIITSKLGF